MKRIKEWLDDQWCRVLTYFGCMEGDEEFERYWNALGEPNNTALSEDANLTKRED